MQAAAPATAPAKPSVGQEILPAISRLTFSETGLHTLRGVLLNVNREDDSRPVLQSICFLLENRKTAIECLTTLMELQLETEVGSSMCLRGDGVAIGLIARYFTFLGTAFLRQSLQPVVSRIYALGDYSLENPRTPRSMSKGSMGKLLGGGAQSDTESYDTLTALFLNSVAENINFMPIQVQQVMRNLIKLLERRYATANRQGLMVVAVASTLFLRFFVPAIIAPVFYDIVKHQPNKAVARNLLVFARHIQSKVSAAVAVFTATGASANAPGGAASASAQIDALATTCIKLIEYELPKPEKEEKLLDVLKRQPLCEVEKARKEQRKKEEFNYLTSKSLFDGELPDIVKAKEEEKKKPKEKEKAKELAEKEKLLSEKKKEKEKEKEREKQKEKERKEKEKAKEKEKPSKEKEKPKEKDKPPAAKPAALSSSPSSAPPPNKNQSDVRSSSPKLSLNLPSADTTAIGKEKSDTDLASLSTSDSSEVDTAKSINSSLSSSSLSLSPVNSSASIATANSSISMATRSAAGSPSSSPMSATAAASSVSLGTKKVKLDKATFAELKKQAGVLAHFMLKYQLVLFAPNATYHPEVWKLLQQLVAEDPSYAQYAAGTSAVVAMPSPPSTHRTSPRKTSASNTNTSDAGSHSSTSSPSQSLSSSTSAIAVAAISASNSGNVSATHLNLTRSSPSLSTTSSNAMNLYMDILSQTEKSDSNNNSPSAKGPRASPSSIPQSTSSHIVRTSSEGGPILPPIRPVPLAASPQNSSPLAVTPTGSGNRTGTPSQLSGSNTTSSVLTQAPNSEALESPHSPHGLSSQQLDSELLSSLTAAQQRAAWEKRSKSPQTVEQRGNSISLGAAARGASSPRESPTGQSPLSNGAAPVTRPASHSVPSSSGSPTTNGVLSYFASGGSFVALQSCTPPGGTGSVLQRVSDATTTTSHSSGSGGASAAPNISPRSGTIAGTISPQKGASGSRDSSPAPLVVPRAKTMSSAAPPSSSAPPLLTSSNNERSSTPTTATKPPATK